MRPGLRRSAPDRLSKVLWEAPPPIPAAQYFNLGTSSYMRNQVEPFFNGLMRDAIGVTHIMKAAVDYHMWDACAYTFALKRG